MRKEIVGLIAAGTGLGEAILVWNGHSYSAHGLGRRPQRLCRT